MEKLAREFSLIKASIEELETKLSKLEIDQSRAEGSAAEYENALLSGESDPQLVFSLRDTFSGLREIAFEKGRISIQLDDLRAEQRLIANTRDEAAQDRAQPDENDWVERLAAKNSPVEAEKTPEKETERVAAPAEIEWWEVDDPQERAVAEQRYREWEKSRNDPNHVDDLDEPALTRSR